jgi:HK97 gp10 family phage protein
MSGISMGMEGMPELRAALRRYGERAERELNRALEATGIELRGDVVKRYQRGPATGVVYEKVNPTRTHQASAPGEAPATDTGRLANSVTFQREGKLSVTVGSQIVYAAMLEFGTSRMASRPAWVPAVEDMRDKFRERVEAAMRRAAT